MKIRTCPDVIRRHARTHRTYREATGRHAVFEERRTLRHLMEERGLHVLTYTLIVVLIVVLVG